MKKIQRRTDPNLPANIEEDYEILKNKAIKIYHRYKNQIESLDDMFQFLCETYLEAKDKWALKTRVIPIRPFVFNYIEFILMRKYRGQYKFENRSTFPVDEVLDPHECMGEFEEPYIERNPFLFENSYDLNRILSKYSFEDRLIIYYKFYLNKPTNEIEFYLPSKTKVTYVKIKQLRDQLKRDPELLKLVKES